MAAINFPIIQVEQIQTFLIVTSRVAGFISAIPILSSAQTPARIKTGLTIACAITLFPVMADKVAAIDFSPFPFMLLLISELLLGLIIGLIARMIFTAVEFGATVIGFQMGFAAANVFDPQNQRQIELLSQFQNVFASLIFLAINGHHIFIQTAAFSYQILPPGMISFAGEGAPYLIKLASHMFALGVQFSAPVLAILLLSGLILGMLARVFPQLNVFLLSYPINIGVGFIVIGLTLDLASTIIRREFDTIGERFITILNYLHP